MHQFQLSFSWSKLWSLIQFFKIEKKLLIEITCRLDFTFDNKHFRISTQTSKITLLETIKTSFMYMVIFHFEMACWICELNNALKWQIINGNPHAIDEKVPCRFFPLCINEDQAWTSVCTMPCLQVTMCRSLLILSMIGTRTRRPTHTWTSRASW
jgi:hypothetical protein